MYDRAMQALHALALSPIAETLAARHSYGFRPGRSTADAIGQCFSVLARRNSASWILEADIEGCFDNISHEWLLAHVSIQHTVLRQWLKSGFVDQHRLFPTEQGVPQGGIISPIVSNLTLDALEERLEEAIPKRSQRGRRAKVNIIRYADDFVITGSSPEVLRQEVLPLVQTCLDERGLRLSSTKTQLSHIDDGFDFLGQNVRKYDGKLLITPSRKSQKAFKRKVKATLHRLRAAPQRDVIVVLNPIIRGWANYHRHVVSSAVFSKLDHWLWLVLWRWSRRRHPHKSRSWVKERYFGHWNNRDWVFIDRKHSGAPLLVLSYLSWLPIRRHVQVRADADPFDPAWADYWASRAQQRQQRRHLDRCRIFADSKYFSKA
jgi:RNA-directed DNA polymerase